MSDLNEMTLIASKGTLDWAYPPLFWLQLALQWAKKLLFFVPSMA